MGVATQTLLLPRSRTIASLQLDGPFLFLFPWRVKIHFSISLSIAYIKVNVMFGDGIILMRHFQRIQMCPRSCAY